MDAPASHHGSPIVSWVARAVSFQVGAGYDVDMHLHHFYQLDVVLRGRFDVRLEDRQTVQLKDGDAFLTPPLVRHAYHAPQPADFAVFKFHVAPRYWLTFGSQPKRQRLSGALLELTVQWARDSARHVAPPPTLWHQRTASLLTLCLTEMCDSKSSAGVGGNGMAGNLDSFRQSLWPMLEQIENNPCADWSVARLAEKAGLSAAHFSRCFRRLLGKSPKRYLHESRMRFAAAQLVVDPSPSIKQISRSAGYADVHAFTHAFCDFFGTSPGAYRRHSVGL